VFGVLTIWVDAICINQDDEDEKMAQILLMKDIYSHAETVYIWLGLGSASTDRAIHYLMNTGFVRNIFVDGNPTKGLLSKPSVWKAAWLGILQRRRRSGNFPPGFNKG
jgi:hypothetical protein